MDWAWTKPHELDREGKRRGPEAIPCPIFHLPFLYFVIYWSVSQGRWAPIPRGKGAGLPSWAACGERLPPPLSPQSRGPSLPSSSERRRGGLAATSLAPCATQSRPLWLPVAWGQLWMGSLSSVSRVLGAPPPPVLWPCPCPRGRGRRTALLVPLRLRGLHGRILFPRGHWAMWRGGREDGGSPRPRLLVGLPAAGITQ